MKGHCQIIPDNGLKVATYILTRMLQIILKREPKENVVVVAFAVITIIVTAVVAGDLLLRGTTGVSLPELTR